MPTAPPVTVDDGNVPAVGLGTLNATGEVCRNAIEHAIDVGYRHIDTAQMYDNEAAVGEAIAASSVDRDELFITTKIHPRNARPEDVHESVAESLERLRLDRVDLLLLHWPNPVVDLESTVEAMNELYDEGKTRHLGVSNFSVSRLDRARELSDAPILVDQVLFHPFYPQRDLLRYCQRNGVILTGYSPLNQGLVLSDPLMQQIGEQYGKTPAQVALRWAVQHENVVTIPKSTTPAHIEENIDIFDFSLSKSEVARITRPSYLKTGRGFLRMTAQGIRQRIGR